MVVIFRTTFVLSPLVYAATFRPFQPAWFTTASTWLEFSTMHRSTMWWYRYDAATGSVQMIRRISDICFCCVHATDTHHYNWPALSSVDINSHGDFIACLRLTLVACKSRSRFPSFNFFVAAAIQMWHDRQDIITTSQRIVHGGQLHDTMKWYYISFLFSLKEHRLFT